MIIPPSFAGFIITYIWESSTFNLYYLYSTTSSIPRDKKQAFYGKEQKNTGQEEGGTHVFYSDFSGHGTETSK